jgi:hypothetical protein
MCTPQAKPDPRLAGFVAPTRNIVNPFKSELTRYTDMESDTAYYKRDNAAYRAWKADPANAGKTRTKLERLRGGEGMSAREGSSAYKKRQQAELAAFEASDLGKANESTAAYNARLKAAQQEYINRGTTGTPSATGVAGAPSVASTDRMANKLKQKTAQRASRASSGRAMLRIGR